MVGMLGTRKDEEAELHFCKAMKTRAQEERIEQFQMQSSELVTMGWRGTRLEGNDQCQLRGCLKW
jgi:hypothetical protein